MTYNELCESILTAQEEMFKCKIEANSITLNGRKYGKLVENCPAGMKPTIFGMAVKADYAMPDDYDFLVQHEPPKPMTNADRIRSMTDWELAIWKQSGCPGSPKPCMKVPYRVDCTSCWLDWLKQEVE